MEAFYEPIRFALMSELRRNRRNKLSGDSVHGEIEHDHVIVIGLSLYILIVVHTLFLIQQLYNHTDYHQNRTINLLNYLKKYSLIFSFELIEK